MCKNYTHVNSFFANKLRISCICTSNCLVFAAALSTVSTKGHVTCEKTGKLVIECMDGRWISFFTRENTGQDTHEQERWEKGREKVR